MLNSDFYRDNAASFSQTRSAAWPGWSRCVEVLADSGLDLGRNADDHNQPKRSFSSTNKKSSRETGPAVLDLACGNLRFESYLSTTFPEVSFTFYAVDNCDTLVPRAPAVNFQRLDVLKILFSDGKGHDSNGEQGINDTLTAPLCDLSVSFGFLHHVPIPEYRTRMLESLIRQTRSGGFVIVSLWQFLNSEELARKAEATHHRALRELRLPELDTNDYLLGWKDIPGQYRYCHSFTDVEIDQLIESVTGYATLISRFVSDGRTDNLNTYLVLKTK